MNEKEKDSDTRIYALDGLRGLAALAVVAYHYTGGTLRQLLPGAQFVTLFFILSGLVLSIVPLCVGIDTYNWPRYQLRRIARLAIPTCTAIGICCIVSTIAMHMGWKAEEYANAFSTSSPSVWLHNLLTQLDMLSMTTAGTRVDGSTLAMADLPSWSMCWELLFSLALPIYVIIATDMRFVAPIALACVLLSEWTQWPPLRHMAMFALGVALAKRLTDNGRETMRDVVAVPLALCGMVVVALTCNVVSDLLSTPPVRWLGRISFSLYLTHLPVRDWIVPYIPVQGLLRPMVLFALCLLVAEAFYLAVERPATRLSRKLGKVKREA